MAPRWTNSADKHGIPRTDQIFALVNATYTERLPGESLDEGEVWLYLGHPHAHTDQEIEILVTV
ncbi:hypothetical protein [Frondihabitans sp. Leaf304]|uniref:hypothetical protein n=1 Tax=Frondihabitans sp. Leaf304 TaxID=1736329 RepID=UPI0012FBC445|nr:hypothetical protein [Frondihabitans sp. Leaf304]